MAEITLEISCDPPELKEMSVFRLERGGAIYHFAGRDEDEAAYAAWQFFDAEEGASAIGITFTMGPVDRDEWKGWTYHDDGEGDLKASFADLVARTEEAGVLICSEWP